MKSKHRGLSLGAKLQLLIIAVILVVAAGLVGISYYVFCRRVDNDYFTRTKRAAVSGTYSFDLEDLTEYRDLILSEEYQELRKAGQWPGQKKYY